MPPDDAVTLPPMPFHGRVFGRHNQQAIIVALAFLGMADKSASQSPTVLLVDDDDDVRETSAEMLEELGYVVLQAESGSEALSIVESHPQLDVLVTDVRMPGMTGLELSAKALARRHGLRVILISGFFRPQALTCRFLQKPFRTHELDAAIRAELDSS
ncbi:MAG: response regulator [Acetobacteraceae bacterium]|nr:response regulator [Acetobacteraceae bacterium]